MKNKFIKALLVILCLLCSFTGAEAYTTTTNYSLKLPQVNNATDQDLWGGYLNDNTTEIDTQLLLDRDWKKRSITGTDSVVASDRHKILLCDATSAAFTLTLLAAATAADGFQITIVKTDSSAHAVTLDGNASETIGGATTFALSGQGDAATLISDGTNWNFAGNKTTPSAVPSASTSAQGIIEIATNAETLAGADATRAVTPASIASLATSGKLVMGAVTFQWGTATRTSSFTTVAFPISFSGEPYNIQGTFLNGTAGGGSYPTQISAVSSSGFTFYDATAGSLYWFAIGPT